MVDRFDELFGPAGDRFDSTFGPESEQQKKRREAWEKPPINRVDPGIDALKNPAQAKELARIRRNDDALAKATSERREREAREEAAARKASEDSWLTVAKKAFQNAPEMMFELPAGGVMQAAGKIAADHVEGAATALAGPGFGKLVGDTLQPILVKANEPIAERGKQIADEARAELERNDPNATGLKRFSYDVITGFLQFGSSLAAAGITKSPTVGATVMGAQVFGEQVDDSLRRGRTIDEAIGDATFMGAAEIITERVPLKILLSPGGDGILKRAGKGALAEGIQESMTEALQTGYDIGILNEEMTFGEAVKQIVYSGLVGSAVGGGAAVASHPFVRDRQPKPFDGQKPDNVFGDPLTDPRTASQAFSPGRDTVTPMPRGVPDAADAHAMQRGAEKVDQGDVDSPLPTDLIQQGKGQVEIDLEHEAEDGILSQLGLPKVGTEVAVRRGPDGVDEIGRVLGSFTVSDEFGAKHGIRVQMNDGSTYEELVDDIRSGGQSIVPLDERLNAPVARDRFEIPEVSESDMDFRETPPATVQPVGSPRNVLKAKIKRVESGGDPNAKNPKSTASGLYQFLDETWKALGGNPARKNDPAEQERLMEKLLDQNEAALGRAGIPVTAGNLYLAHFLGAGGAIKALKNPNGRPSAAVIEANPFLAKWTNAEIAAWANRKMGGKAGEYTTNPNLAADKAWAEKDKDADGFDLAFPKVGFDDGSGQSLADEYAAAVEANPSLARITGEKIDDEWVMFSPDAGSLGIPRAEMPQVKGEHRGALVNFLEARGVKHEEAKATPAETLKPTQAEFSPKKAASWDKGNVKLEERAILTSSDGHILDGHHQWVKALERGEDVYTISLDAPIAELVPLVREFPSAKLSDGAFPKQDALKAKLAGSRLTGEPTVQPDLLGGPAVTAAEMDARAYVPQVLEKARKRDEERDSDRTERLVEAAQYVLNATNAAGDRRQSLKELGQELGRKMETWDEAQAYAREILRQTNNEVAAPEPEPPATNTEIVQRDDLYEQALHQAESIYGPTPETAKERADYLAGAIGEYGNGPSTAAMEKGRAFASAFLRGEDWTRSEGLDRINRDGAALDYNTTERHERVRIMQAAGINSKMLAGGPKANSGTPFDDLPQSVQILIAKQMGYAAAEASDKPESENRAPDAAGEAVEANERRHPKQDALKAKMEAKRRYPDDETSRTGFIAGAEGQASRHMTSTKMAEAYAAGAEWAAQKRGSTAPEHAAVGVDDRELSEVVITFDQYLDGQGKGDNQITHVFDPPAKDEIVRLQDKARVYNAKHGWMSVEEAQKKIREWEEHAVDQGRNPETRNANGEKVVLSFFDLSGEWSMPWEQAGYDVWRFDIQNDPEMGDVNNFSTDFFNDWFGSFEGKDIYAILAACPCTDFAVSGARHFAAKDKDGRTVASVKLVQQTLAAIEFFKPAVWAIENPVGRIEKLGGLPPWRLSFDPNHLGETYTKKTLLWGRFNADLPIAPVEPTEGSKMHRLYGGKSLKTKNARSVTPEGFAYAFFMANNAIDHPVMAIANKYDRLDRKLIEQAVAAGVTEDQINEAVEDPYYADLDDAAANAALEGLIAEAKGQDNRLTVTTASGQTRTVDPAETRRKQLELDADDLIAKAEPFQAELVDWAERQPFQFENPGLKSKKRIVEKVQNENYESVLDIKDVVRGGFVVASPKGAEKAIAAVKERFNVAEGGDKGWKVVDGGYYDYKLILDFDGVKAEIQIIPERIFKAKKGGLEAAYNEWRELPDFDSPNPVGRSAQLLEQMITGYANAVSGTSFASAFKEAMERYASGNSFANSVWGKLDPPFLTSPGAAPQDLPLNTNANPRPLDDPLATGRPSISTNQRSESSAIAADISSPAVASKEWGSNNKLVTRDRAEEIRKKLRDKLKNQLNSGIDPELLALGTELAVFHIEAGARKFADFAKAMVDDLGLSHEQAKRLLRGWYNGARDMMEDMGAPVGDMDTALSQEEATAILAFQILRGNLDLNADSGIIPAEEQSDASATETDRAGSDDRNGDEGQSAGDAPRAESERGASEGSQEPSEGGAGQLRAGDERSDNAGSDIGPSVSREGRDNDSASERSGQRGDRAGGGVRDGRDYRAPTGGLKRTGSWQTTAARNLEIVELVNQLETENRPATPKEQELLAKFVGWGASDIRNRLFSDRVVRRNPTTGEREIRELQDWERGSDGWAELIDKARGLLKGEALEQALQSTQYAHYTSEGVVRSIWQGLERLGFHGGRVLEPGMGIGNFFMLAPDAIADQTTYTGIELDEFTAKVAKHLLPRQNVIHGDYVKQSFPNGFFDAAIGNPPFSQTKILDDPAYKKHRFSLHDYFFAKTIDKVRPGGLLVFVTSRYTMDKLDNKARQYIADRADLIGAIRLPQTAFKENAGTEVVTDVLFLQKRPEGVEAGGEAWLGTAQITASGEKFHINEYFKNHPEMVLGKHSATGSMYRSNEYTVEPYARGSIETLFADAIKNLPEGIYTKAVEKQVETAKAKTFERDFAPASSKEGGLYEKDGKILVVDQGSGIPVDQIGKVSANDKVWLKGYIKLRDALKEAQKAQLEDAADWEAKLDKLRKVYAAHVKKHGRLLEFTAYERTTTDDDGEKTTTVYRRYKWQRLFDLDTEGVIVQQLEKITDEGEIEEGAFLKGRTLNKPARPKIETASDALAVTLDETGRVDLDYAANLLGQSRDAIIAELGESIYLAPDETWQTADEYLSGNVLTKLEEAQAAAALDPKFQRNVTALQKVQPKPLTYDQIFARLGAGWIDASIVQQFVEEEIGITGADITYEPVTGSWEVEGSKQRWRRSNTHEYGTAKRSPLELLDAILNNRTIKITEKVDKKTVEDKEATAAANEAAKKISERFSTWIWQDAKRTEGLVELYNRKFNNIAPRHFNGDHLTLPGLSAHFKPHPHVKRAVWRIIQTGNTYLAHAVGAGKTAEQIISAMEQRRLGLIKKPMFVVPNHMLNQFAREFLELYPAANIMVADEKSFHTSNRRRFMAQAALNDPDAIIVTHSSFGKLATSEQTRADVTADLLGELEAAFDETEGDQQARHQRRKLEQQIEQMKRRIEGKKGDKDKTLTFEEMGVDFLYIDEAHEFRRLDFATNRQAKGISSNGSARALDLFVKARWLNRNNPGRSLVLASGTPITNTMAELYTVMRYMAYDELQADGLQSFDAWANMFGEIAEAYEQNPAGGYEIVARFAKFVNVPELMKRVRSFMDVLTGDQLGSLVKRPAIKGGAPENAVVPASEKLQEYMKVELDRRLQESRAWKPSPQQPGNPDPVINIITDARLASIDMRFVNPRLGPNGSKLDAMLDKIIAKNKEFASLTYVDPKTGAKDLKKGPVQIVFSAVGFGEMVAKNRGFDVREYIDSKLIAGGFKKSEIGWMSDAGTHAKKEALQKDVRAGKVKVLIGSPQNMGTGLNVQRRLKVLHYLSPPWYPSDVEQPHGRIIRQGNLNEEAEIYWYATKGTYDSTQWGMVSRKQGFINQAMSGDDSVRSIEDISEINQFEMAAALAAGDDRLIRVASLGGEIERLSRLEGAHSQEQRQLKSNKSTAEFLIDKYEKEIAKLQSAVKAREGDPFEFSFTIGKQTFDKQKDAGEALIAAIEESWSPRQLGKLYDKHPVRFEKGEYGNKIMVDVGDAAFKALNLKRDDVDPTGLLTRIVNKVRGVPSALSEAKADLNNQKAELAAIGKKLGAPFPYKAELTEKIAEKAALQAEIAADAEAAEKAKQAAKQAAQGQPPPPVAASAFEGGAVLGPDLTPEQERKVAAEAAKLLKQLLPNKDVALKFEQHLRAPTASGDLMAGRRAQGYYDPARTLIAISYNASHGHKWVLGHEALHAMRDLGLITKTEWNLLVADAWHSDSEMRDDVRRRWKGLSEEAMQEEAVAERFGSMVDMVNLGETPAQKLAMRVLMRLMDAMVAIVKAVRKVLGQPTARLDAYSLMRRMARGEIGAREANSGDLDVGYGARFLPAPPTESAAFKRWFGDSRVVDENGDPLVVYHGTLSDFNEFRRFSHFGTKEQANERVAASEALDDEYRGVLAPKKATQKPNVVPVYLKIENPMRVTDDLGEDGWTDKIAEAKRLGHDGIVYLNRGELTSTEQEILRKRGLVGDSSGALSDEEFRRLIPSASDSYITFEPAQVKSAIGNTGTFDPANPDIRYSIAGDIEPASPEFEDATEQRYKDATKGVGSGPGLIEKATGFWADLKAGFSRHWRDLPNEPRFANVQQQLRKLEAAHDAALERTVRHLRDLVGKLNKEEYDLFQRKVILDDLMWEADREHSLPFGFTPESLREAVAKIDEIIKTAPKVTEAVRKRKLFNRRLADEMVEAGVLTPEQVKNPAYYRHMILDYARAEARAAKAGKVDTPYWAKRMGSSLDINANFLEAEFDWQLKAQVDIATAKTIEWIKKSDHNKREELRAQAKADNKAMMAEIMAEESERGALARKLDGKFRSNIKRGLDMVKDELEAGLTPPPHLRAAADALATNSDDASVFPLLSWILDEDKPGAMGAAMVLSAVGRRKAWEKEMLRDRYVDPDDIAELVKHYKPEGYRGWQPREGQHLFTAKTMSQHALDMFVSKLGETPYEGVDKAELERALQTVRPQLVVGGDRYTMVIPDELALTLDGYGDRRMAGMVAQVFAEIQAKWKQWTLINPRRFFKYNFNNQSGDLDAIVAGNPGALRYVAQAAKEIAAVWRGKQPATDAYREALERGVFTSGLSAQEIPDINAFSGLRHLQRAKSKRPDRLMVQAAANFWNALQTATNYREAIFRYAAYLDYKQKIESGMPQEKIGYGASVPKMVDAVTDPADRAALLARDLIGDYGAISVAGGWLRRYMIPFWSWTEINTKRYWRLVQNGYRVSAARGIATGGLMGAAIAARTAAMLYIRMGIVYAGVQLWNHLLFPDEEDELGEMQQAQLHLIIGRDSTGQVVTLRFQGALSDVFELAGFNDAVAGIKRWHRGQGTIGQAIKDTLLAPVNKIGTSVTPMFSVPAEQLMGKETWPDLTEPRMIHDRWRHVFSTFTLENEYDALAGKPSRGYGESWTQSFVYRRDPGELAYNEARSLAYEWLENVKGMEGGEPRTSPRSQALRDYKMALRFGDREAADKALDRYEQYEGTVRGLKQSIKSAHPLAPISKKDRPAFVQSLTDEQFETLVEAERFYTEVYLGGGKGEPD